MTAAAAIAEAAAQVEAIRRIIADIRERRGSAWPRDYTDAIAEHAESARHALTAAINNAQT